MLPIASQKLVPRDGELRDIVRLLLHDGVRLLSLVGPPGAGKTRLALMAAVELADAFPEGIVFVDLTPLQDPALVLSAIASALGVREANEARIVARLLDVMREQRVLLILDNFEHVLPAGAAIADLLGACPQLRVLATSREALHVGAEHRLKVGPLRVPSKEEEEGDARLLEDVPAAALFCMRARAVRNDWTLDAANTHAVAELCRRLDGLPLAIELAAAWVGVLSPRALLARLEQCLNSEVSRAPDLPERHRTLEAAIGWSYDLLLPEERALFDRLATFAGGWSLEAAAEVSGTAVGRVLPTLAALTEKHLIVTAEQAADGEPRFGMLDTLHAFAGGRMEASPDATAVRRRHAEHFLALAESAERALAGPEQRFWLDRLERELENLRTALKWATEVDETELALRLASALWFFWDMRGHLHEGRQSLEVLLALPAAAASPSRAAALNAAGWLALVQHAAYGPAIELLEDARATAQSTGDMVQLARAQAFGGLAIAIGTREHERAEELLESAVQNGRALHDVWVMGLALYGLGHLAILQGRGDSAREHWQACAAVVQGAGNLYGQSYLQFRWGVLGLAELDLDRARLHLGNSLRLATELDSTRERAVAVAGLAMVAHAGGDAERGARLGGVTQALLDRAGCDLPVFLRAGFEQSLAGVQNRLGSVGFAHAFADGRGFPATMILNEALDGHSATISPIEAPVLGSDERHAPLSAREWEVAHLVAKGLTNRQIGERLVLAERTVGAHLERIYTKLQLQRRTQLAVWAVEREALSRSLGREGMLDEVDIPTDGSSRQSKGRLHLVGE
jgi:predicted ATPase/DNA-binding CsgD family transcriptional regulator